MAFNAATLPRLANQELNLGKALLAFFLLVNNALPVGNNGEKDCFIEAIKVKPEVHEWP